MVWNFYNYFKSKIAFTFIIIALVFLGIALLGIISAWQAMYVSWTTQDLSAYMFITFINKALVEPAVLAGIGFIIEYLYRILLALQRINNDASGKALFGSDDGKKG
jgi:hypothetical protein